MCISVSCGSDLLIKIWDTQNDWKNTKTFPGHDHSISSVRFLPGDDFIISASRDKSIRVWNIAMGYVTCDDLPCFALDLTGCFDCKAPG